MLERLVQEKPSTQQEPDAGEAVCEASWFSRSHGSRALGKPAPLQELGIGKPQALRELGTAAAVCALGAGSREAIPLGAC